MRERTRGRGGPNSKFDKDSGDRGEDRFLEDLENRIQYFLSSEDKELDLEPMNSYKRRLAHKVATDYKLETDSRGEEPNRYVRLIRTEASEAPKEKSRPKLWDFGMQTFSVNPGEHGERMALKMDGSVELYQESEKHKVVDERIVTTRQFRIRKGKIVTPDDAGW